MIWLFSALLSAAMLLSCSAESARVKTEEPREAQPSGVVIDFATPSQKLFLAVNWVNRSGLGMRLASIRKNIPDPMSVIDSTAPTVISMPD